MLNELMVKLKESPMKNVSVEEMLKTYCLYKNEIDDFVKKSVDFMFFVKNSSIQNKSIYLDLETDLGSCYVRAGFDKYSKFGHPCFCISNISFDDDFIGKGIFTVYIAIMLKICLAEKWIFYVENPLEKRFQDFLKHSGFKSKEVIGNYFFMLPDNLLVSEREYYTLEQTMNFQK